MGREGRFLFQTCFDPRHDRVSPCDRLKVLCGGSQDEWDLGNIVIARNPLMLVSRSSVGSAI